MKKLTAGILAAALVMSAGTTSAYAAYENRRANYVDANNDGICDNYKTGNNCVNGTGKDYVDADGDGVCDNKETSVKHQRKGRSCGSSTRKGSNCGNGMKKGSGCRRGACGRR